MYYSVTHICDLYLLLKNTCNLKTTKKSKTATLFVQKIRKNVTTTVIIKNKLNLTTAT